MSLLLGVGLGNGCTARSFDSDGLLSPPGLGMGGGNTYVVEGGPSTGGQGGAPLSSLCGHAFDCANPDDVLACKRFQGSAGKPTDAGIKGAGGTSSGGAMGSGGSLPTGGTSGNAPDSGAKDAGHDGSAGPDASDAGDASSLDSGSPVDSSIDRSLDDRSAPGLDTGTIGAGGTSNSGPPDAHTPPVADAGLRYSCQVALPPASGSGGSTSLEPFSQCLPAGERGSGSPCLSSADCRPGLACVAGLANARNGQCLPYCCDPTTSCEKAWVALGGGGPDSGSNLYCGDRALVDGSQRSTLRVPVCVLPDRCTLGDPYPCTGTQCQCPSGTACAVTVIPGDVRGTTYCAVPGKGRANDPCSSANPCAAGYFCSTSRGVCLKVCSTDGFDSACAPGRCQQAAGFPADWGVCVGAVPAAK